MHREHRGQPACRQAASGLGGSNTQYLQVTKNKEYYGNEYCGNKDIPQILSSN